MNLNQLYSHTAGAHGVDACVKIIKIEVGWNYWCAEARHMSSPDTESFLRFHSRQLRLAGKINRVGKDAC